MLAVLSDPALLSALTEPLQLLPLGEPLDPMPEDEDVRAGWVAFALFGAMALAVVVLAFSLVKQLGKARRAHESGVYGDPVQESEGEPPAGRADEPPRDA